MRLAWIALAAFACGPNGTIVEETPQICAPRDPGRATIHRLNRAEYNNTIRDLLADDSRPADDFPADDFGYGFDNISDVLSISPLLFEKYELAATAAIGRAFSKPIETEIEMFQA